MTVPDLPPGYVRWADVQTPPAMGEVPDALGQRGLPRDAGLDVLLEAVRQETLRELHKRLQRRTLGTARGSWAQAAALVRRVISGDP